MARKRMIDPSIWADEDFGNLSPMAQILFIGMISNADDEGRLPGNALFLTSTIMPFKGLSKEKSIELRNEVVTHMRSVILYAVDEKEYLQFMKWRSYQTINKASESKYPSLPEDYGSTTVVLPSKRIEEKLSKENIKDKSLIGKTPGEVPPVKERYGNIEINQILDTFKMEFGRLPADKYPRNVAQNIRMIVNTFIKNYGEKFLAVRGTALESVYVYQKFYANLKTSDYWDKIEKLETVKQKLKVYLDLVGSDLALEYSAKQEAEKGNYAENTN